MWTALLAAACARPNAPASAASVPSATPAPIGVPRTIITPKSATSIPELYQHAASLAASGKHSEAAAEFDRVFELDPTGELADDALFQGAFEHHQAGELEPAARGYEELSRRFPESEFSLRALVRASALNLYLERYARSGELAQHALTHEAQLGTFDKVLLDAASALARLEQDDEKAAESFIERGRELIDAQRLDAAGKVSYELAPLYYALGELRRRRAERIVFDPTPPNFAEVLESRCQLLLDAQSAYSDTWRAYDSHWSAMAGYRVGELYQRLHEDLMHIHAPATADTLEKQQLFEGAMRLRYAILLEKALGMMKHTLSMSDRTHEQSPWVERARQAQSSIERAMREEQESLARLPYSKATLEEALAQLQRRSEKKSEAEKKQRSSTAAGQHPLPRKAEASSKSSDR